MTENSIPLCIHHHPCADGFSAAWAVRQRFGENVEFFAGVHGEAPPDVTDRHVILVDFSYKRDVLFQMMEQAASILVLDHHKSAQFDLAGFPVPAGTWELHLEETERYRHQSPLDRIGVRFDMNKSGCVMAWDYFHPGKPVPQFLLHAQDRDLWRFKLPGTREITATTFSYDYTFENWDHLVAACESSRDKQTIIHEGNALLRQHDKTIRELLPQMQRLMVIAGYAVPAANLPYQYASDAGHIMSRGERFAATYWDDPAYRNFSLRSAANGMDVSQIATEYDGGGHQRAAGFRVLLTELVQKGLL